MAYTSVSDVKILLQIPAEDTTYDTELAGCVESSDAVIDSWLLKNGLAIPESAPRNLKDSSTYLAAWLFRRRRDLAEDKGVFWAEAVRFFDAYVDATEEAHVGSV